MKEVTTLVNGEALSSSPFDSKGQITMWVALMSQLDVYIIDQNRKL